MAIGAGLLAQQMAPLVGDVVDELGAPVAAATVVVWRGEGRGFDCLDLDYAHSWRQLARTPVDRSGHFGLQLPVGLVLRVEVEHAGHARWRRDDVTPGERMRIELAAPHTFRGRLLRKTGAGTPGFLRGWDAVDHTELFRGRTDAAGSFEFAQLPPRPFVCDVAPDEAASPEWFKALWDGDVLEHDFVLEDGAVLTGVVFDSGTGKPIAGARVGEGWTLHKAVTTGADGRYVLRGHGDKGRPDVHVRAAGYVARSIDESTRTGTASLEFALMRGTSVTGVVVDPADRPLHDVYVAVLAAWSCQWLSTRTDARGAFTLDGCPPDMPSALLLRRDGSATTVYELPPNGAGGRLDLGSLRMSMPKCVRGVLVDGDGRPVAGAEVALVGTNADREQFTTVPGDWKRLALYLGRRTARTDQSGAFGFGDVAPGSYAIALGRYEGPTLTGVDVDSKGDVDPLRIVTR